MSRHLDCSISDQFKTHHVLLIERTVNFILLEQFIKIGCHVLRRLHNQHLKIFN